MKKIACLLALLLAPLALAGEVVEGKVVIEPDSSPLPGSTVTLQSETWFTEVISDENGRYRIDGVPAGSYELVVKLAGLKTATEQVKVAGPTVIAPVMLSFDEEQVVTFSCGARNCNDTLPESKWDDPLCSDQDLNSLYIESLATGDRAALAELQRRYAAADTYSERRRIGAALLGHGDDGAIWKELLDTANMAIRFVPNDEGEFAEEFNVYAESLGSDPDSVWFAGVQALRYASADRRSHALLLEVVQSGEPTLVGAAIEGLATQGDLGALPAIKAALDGLPDYADQLAFSLAYYANDLADALALEYLPDEYRAVYREMREAATTEPR